MMKWVELFGPQPVDTTAETNFTNTNGITTIVEFISFANPNATSVIVRTSIGADGATTRIIDHSVPANTTLMLYPRWVLTGTDTLQLSCPTSDDTVIAYASGRQYVT